MPHASLSFSLNSIRHYKVPTQEPCASPRPSQKALGLCCQVVEHVQRENLEGNSDICAAHVSHLCR